MGRSSNAVFGFASIIESVSFLQSIDAIESKGFVSFSESANASKNGVPEGVLTIKTVSFKAKASLFFEGIGLSNSFDKPILIL